MSRLTASIKRSDPEDKALALLSRFDGCQDNRRVSTGSANASSTASINCAWVKGFDKSTIPLDIAYRAMPDRQKQMPK
jgi:hypothetical protein